MSMNSYNNETEHSKLLEDLKSLPKMKAPENFELNLLTRIQNQNFGEVKEQRADFNFFKFLVPSGVVVAALIVFFLFIFPGQQQVDNPFMAEPPAIMSDTQGNIKSINKDLAANNITKSSEAAAKIAEPKINKQLNSGLEAKIQPNDVVIKSDQKYPISRNRSIALDEYISGQAQQGSDIQRGSVVNSGENAPDFDGFFVRQQPDKATIMKYRAMLDSVKKAQMAADSIKKARN